MSRTLLVQLNAVDQHLTASASLDPDPLGDATHLVTHHNYNRSSLALPESTTTSNSITLSPFNPRCRASDSLQLSGSCAVDPFLEGTAITQAMVITLASPLPNPLQIHRANNCNPCRGVGHFCSVEKGRGP